MISSAIFYLIYAMFAIAQTGCVSKSLVHTIKAFSWFQSSTCIFTKKIHLILGRLGLLILTIGTGLDNMRHVFQCLYCILWPQDAILPLFENHKAETLLLENDYTTSPQLSSTTILWDYHHQSTYQQHHNLQPLHYLRKFLLACSFGHYVLTPIAMFSITQLLNCSSQNKKFSSHNNILLWGSGVNNENVEKSSSTTLEGTTATKSARTAIAPSSQEHKNNIFYCSPFTFPGTYNDGSSYCLAITSVLVFGMMMFQFNQYIKGPARHPIQIKLLSEHQQQQDCDHPQASKFYSLSMSFSSAEHSINGALGIIFWQVSLIVLFAVMLLQEFPRQSKFKPVFSNVALHRQERKMSIITLAILLLMNVGCLLWHALHRNMVNHYCRGDEVSPLNFLCDGGWLAPPIVSNLIEQISILSHVWLDHVVNNDHATATENFEKSLTRSTASITTASSFDDEDEDFKSK